MPTEEDCHSPRHRTGHQQAVDKLLVGIGHKLPPEPQLPYNPEVLATWARLQLEELWEYIDAAGVVVETAGCRIEFSDLKVLRRTDKEPDLVGIVDAAADQLVIATGMLSLCGVADGKILEEVDSNNLLKVDPEKGGYIDKASGKFIKPPNHPKPNFQERLRQQGWKEPT